MHAIELLLPNPNIELENFKIAERSKLDGKVAQVKN